MSWAKNHQRTSLTLALALALVVGATGTVVAASIAKSAKAVTAVKTLTTNDYLTTESTTYIDVPGMSTSISVPASQQALLIITFAAPTECSRVAGDTAEADCSVRVLVDGAAVTPAESVLRSGRNAGGSNTGRGWMANAMQFVRGPLTAGSHTVKVQWKVFNFSGGSQFILNGASLTILRSKV